MKSYLCTLSSLPSIVLTNCASDLVMVCNEEYYGVCKWGILNWIDAQVCVLID